MTAQFLSHRDDVGHEEIAVLVETFVQLLSDRGARVAVAESVTGGMVASAVVGISGASRVLDGGIVAYSHDVKHRVLGVDREILERRGAVDADVAIQMAQGVCRVMSPTTSVVLGMATTGVAGVEPQDGREPGVVFIAATFGQRTVVEELQLDGDRNQIRHATAGHMFRLAIRLLRAAPQRE